ncbi:TonB-dependent receptor domain-containing protein [Thalassotalea marina]|uniref:TonB-dependent receptor n=1 Tax=Thalassotalea marina TaxID=1673741 RepID=A0A919ELT8_9GAMM|nr:TonB-dependent receptor [Thalassotalea marina]GHF95893.1 hypothetical protein GCM10017161_25260 [Thalassotalea marina]
MRKLNLLTAAIKVACLSAGISTYAFAAETEDKKAEEESIERISVTGSKIARPGTDTIRPSVNVDVELFEKRGFTNVADALNEAPMFGNGVDPNGASDNGFSVGQNFVDLFDLGTQRTLTLVNGRRFVSSNAPTSFGAAGGLQVDLNAIPAALIENIEIVPMAGAAVYGSDAIAGVVNVQLKDDFEGFEFSTTLGQTDESDGKTRQFQIVTGTNFDDDRGNIVFSVEHSHQDGMLRSARPAYTSQDLTWLNYGGLDLDGDGVNDDVDGDGDPDSFRRLSPFPQVVQLLTAGGAIAPPGSFFAPSVGRGQLADGNFYQFNPQGNLETCEPGETPAGSIFFAYGGTCGEDFFDQVSQLRSPLQRTVISVNSHYDFNDRVRFSQEFNYLNSRAEELVNQGGFQSFPFPGTSSFVTMDIDNPFLTDQARGVLSANGLNTFSLNRFNNDIVGGGKDATENHTWRYYGGFSGNFELGERYFSWEIGATFGKADIESRDAGIIDGRFINAIDAVRLSADSLAPVVESLMESGSDLNGDGVINTADALAHFNAAGGSGIALASLNDIVCQVNIDNAAGNLSDFNKPASGSGITDEDLPYVTGCMPLNLFGQGVASTEALAFINGGPNITSSNIDQRVITASLSGDLIELPAGWLQFAVGYEARQEKGDFTPGLGTTLGVTRSSPFVRTQGQLQTKEFFAELLVPLVSNDMDITGVHLLEVEGSVRKVNNKVTGPNGFNNDEDVTAWEAGLRYSPVEDVALRGTISNGIRTPSLVELFTPKVTAFVDGVDPCDNRHVNNGPNPDVRRANCIADGIADPDSFTSNITNATIKGFAQGNPDLVAEKSESYTYGAVITPRWVEDLTISIDYYNIEIKDRIESYDFALLAESCYDATDFPNVSACNQFKRDPETGQVIDVTELNLNAATSNFESIIYNIFYKFDLANALSVFDESYNDQALGVFDINLNMTRNLKNQLQAVNTRPANRTVGGWARPDLTANFDVTYNIGDWRAFWRTAYQSAPNYSVTGDQFYLDANDRIKYEGKPRIIHNASLSYFMNDNMQVRFGIDNIFEREPNPSDLAAGFFGTVERLGRKYTLAFKASF